MVEGQFSDNRDDTEMGGLLGGVEAGAICKDIFAQMYPIPGKKDKDKDSEEPVAATKEKSVNEGAVVNPDHLKNQIQGAIAMALGGALFEQMRFGDGQISNARFSQYRVPRFSDMPEIDVVLVDRPDLPSAGAGETPIVGLAPAVANAVFHLNGTRLRSLPLEGGL